jgi:antitoxin ParD1/3/4
MSIKSSREFARELIRRDQSRLHLRRLLLDGAFSARSMPADAAYFDGLRERVRSSSQ